MLSGLVSESDADDQDGDARWGNGSNTECDGINLVGELMKSNTI
jgi:hypothetical protein